jgi:hypothetical protein
MCPSSEPSDYGDTGDHSVDSDVHTGNDEDVSLLCARGTGTGTGVTLPQTLRRLAEGKIH